MINTILEGPIRRERAIWAAGLAFALFQLVLLTRGYRITADDIAFFKFGLQGWHSSLDVAYDIAEGQGRIGAFIIIPINVVSALLSDYFAFRVSAAAIYLLNFLLFALWIQRLVGQRIAAPIFVMLAAFNVTDFLHLPPISYPLQNTLPYLLIISARLYLLNRSARLSATAFLALFAFGVGLISTEYGFLLGTAMLFCEWLKSAKGWSFRGLSRALFSGHILSSVAIVVGVLALYVAWRVAHPSRYDGNQIAPISELHRGLITAGWHVISIYLLPYLNTIKTLPYSPLEPRPLSWLSWVGAPLYGALAGGALYMSRESFSLIKRPILTAGVGVALAFYMVLPVALTEKHQSGCLEHRVCTFLDSQLAYFAMTVAFAMVATWLIAKPNKEGRRTRLTVAIALLASVHATFVFIANQRVVDAIERVSSIWESAKVGVCRPDLPASGLSEIFDPTSLLFMHPGFDREEFWKVYVDARQDSCPR